jgi:hypothetical protein
MNRDAKFVIRAGLSLILLILIVGYSYYQARKIIVGPQITITSPKDGATVPTSLVEIDGVANNINSISLDDRPIFIDEKGNFAEKLLLSGGYTIITLKAEDRFGRQIKKTLELYYNAPALIATSSPVI